MSKTIAIKAFNKKEIVTEVIATTKSEELTILQAQAGVNYELFDETTGKAPDHIVTKRKGDNLFVSFEKEGGKAELLIENYYKHSDGQALIGVAEDGSYHYYIPDTGEVSDYVGNLKAGEIEGQALGSESIDTPYWSGGWGLDTGMLDFELPDLSGMSVMKWLVVGTAALGIIPAAHYVKHKYFDDDNDNVITGTYKNDALYGSSDTDITDIIDGKGGNDFIDGKGGHDKIDGNEGDDIIVYHDGDTIDGGVGADILKFTDETSINLDKLAEKVDNIEKLDFVNAKSDNITLSLSDVLNITDKDNELFIAGDKNDKVILDKADGFKEYDSSIDGYHMYSNANHDATLYIADDMSANITGII